MLKKNMLGADKDYVPLIKIKLKNALYKVRCIRMILPKELRKYQGKYNFILLLLLLLLFF